MLSDAPAPNADGTNQRCRATARYPSGWGPGLAAALPRNSSICPCSLAFGFPEEYLRGAQVQWPGSTNAKTIKLVLRKRAWDRATIEQGPRLLHAVHNEQVVKRIHMPVSPPRRMKCACHSNLDGSSREAVTAECLLFESLRACSVSGGKLDPDVFGAVAPEAVELRPLETIPVNGMSANTPPVELIGCKQQSAKSNCWSRVARAAGGNQKYEEEKTSRFHLWLLTAKRPTGTAYTGGVPIRCNAWVGPPNRLRSEPAAPATLPLFWPPYLIGTIQYVHAPLMNWEIIHQRYGRQKGQTEIEIQRAPYRARAVARWGLEIGTLPTWGRRASSVLTSGLMPRLLRDFRSSSLAPKRSDGTTVRVFLGDEAAATGKRLKYSFAQPNDGHKFHTATGVSCWAEVWSIEIR